MTPQVYIEQLGDLLEAGRHQDALDLAERVGHSMLRQLTAEEYDRIGGMLHIAQMTIDLQQASLTEQKS